VFQSNKGPWWVRTCWRTTDMAYYWETLNGMAGQRKGFTKKLLAGVGVDLDVVNSFDQLGDELAQFENRAYTVRVERNGNFLNTYVEGAETAPLPDVPVDDRGLPDPAPAAAAARSAADLFGDDVPF
jgi:hypothetical protein